MSKTREQFPLSIKRVYKITILDTLIWFVILAVCYFVISLIAGSDYTDPVTSYIRRASGLIKTWFFVPLILIGLLEYISQKLHYNFYFYDLTQDFIIIKKGSILTKEITIPYERVQDVYITQDILDKMLDLYDVRFSKPNTSSGREIRIDGLEKGAADGLKKIVLEKNSKKKAMQTNKETSSKIEPEYSSFITKKVYPIEGRWVFKSVWGTLLVLAFLLYLAQNIKQETGIYRYDAFIFIPIVITQLIATYLQLINFHYSLDDKAIVLRQGIFSKKQRLMHYGSIQNVLVKQDLYDKIFGLASITIENASHGAGFQNIRRSATDLLGFRGNKICVPGLKKQNAEALRNIILQKMKDNPIQDSKSGL